MNSANIWGFFLLNLLIFSACFFGSVLEEIPEQIQSFQIVRGLGILAAPILIFILNGILTSDQKAFLVFWKFRNTLPGHRAFTKYAKIDARVNLDRLVQLHGDLPTDEKEQNKLWYRLYRNNRVETVISKAHQNFLLARDLTSLSFLFLLCSLGMFIVFNFKPSFIYASIVIFEYLIMMRLAQNHGRKFVRDVLAIESSN
ncbi:MAG: hypothetical protein ACJLTB_02015 [Algoriphagus aquaeductus]|uniref:hypothetical protein n=1 Tax=Algoriphagus aquaeductus TaxID=475299 RepID=UPI00387A79DD